MNQQPPWQPPQPPSGQQPNNQPFWNQQPPPYVQTLPDTSPHSPLPSAQLQPSPFPQQQPQWSPQEDPVPSVSMTLRRALKIILYFIGVILAEFGLLGGAIQAAGSDKQLSNRVGGV